MSKSPLQRAIECLQISDIWQHSVSASISDDLEGQGHFPDQHEVLYKYVVLRSLWGSAEDDSAPYVFRVYIAVGVRFVDSDASSLDEESSTKHGQGRQGDSVLAQIETTYVAQYVSEIDPGQDALEAFALKNASYHVWPYWREFLASQCARMNLPKLNLPLQSLAGNHHSQSAEES